MDEIFIKPKNLKQRPALPDAPLVYTPVGIAATIERLRLQIMWAVG